MAAFIVTECFDRLVAEGSTSDARTMENHTRSGAPGYGTGKTSGGSRSVVRVKGRDVPCQINGNVIRSNLTL